MTVPPDFSFYSQAHSCRRNEDSPASVEQMGNSADRIARLEQQLEESENRFWSLFENHDRIMLIINPEDGRIMKANQAAVQFYQYPLQDLLKMKITQINTLPDDEILEKMQPSLQQNESSHLFEHRLGNDEVRRVEVQSGPIRFNGRNLLYSIITDITDRTRMQDELQYEKYRLWMILERLKDAVCIADKELDVQYANPTAERAFGPLWPEKKCYAYLHGRSDQCPWCKVGQIQDNESHVTDCLSVVTGRHYDLHVSCFEGPDGQVSYLHVLTDTTERKWSERDLKQHSARLQSFNRRLQQTREEEKRLLSRQLHDSVGQNLTAISINLNVIQALAGDVGEAFTGRLADTQRLVEDTTKQIRNVMAELRPSVLDDYGLPAGLRILAQHFGQRLGINIEVTGEDLIPRPAPEIETELFRIAQEALTNISKYAEAQSVQIRTVREGTNIRMSIQDDGLGFNPEEKEPSHGGNGWGLLTMQERANGLGGILQVSSQPGRGTLIEATIPE
jgi:PAS domain S-box-containing protein